MRPRFVMGSKATSEPLSRPTSLRVSTPSAKIVSVPSPHPRNFRVNFGVSTDTACRPFPLSMQPCYICLEVDPPPLVGVCSCRDRAVHAECLSRWVETSQESTCPVCLEEYRGNVGEAVRSEMTTAKRTRVIIVMASFFCVHLGAHGAGRCSWTAKMERNAQCMRSS